MNAYSRPNSRAKRLLARKAKLIVGRERPSVRLVGGVGGKNMHQVVETRGCFAKLPADVLSVT